MGLRMLSIAALLAACACKAQHSPSGDKIDDRTILDEFDDRTTLDGRMILDHVGSFSYSFSYAPSHHAHEMIDQEEEGLLHDVPTYAPSVSRAPTVPVVPPTVPAVPVVPVASPTMTPTLTPAPTYSPTLSYNEIVAVSVAFTMSGLTCSDYGTDEKATMTSAMATTLGVDESAIGGHTCDDVSRRRHLLSTSVSLGFTVTIVSNLGDAMDTASTLTSALEAAVGDNSLINEITSAAGSSAFATITITISDLETTTVNLTPTASPVAAPKPPPAPPAPTVTPAAKITSGADAVKPALVTVVCASAVWALGGHW